MKDTKMIVWDMIIYQAIDFYKIQGKIGKK